MNVTKSIQKNISQNIQKILGLNISPLNIVWQNVPDPKLGDKALACFELAKQLKTNPVDVAAKLAQNFIPGPEIARVQNAGPYLNIFFSDLYLASALAEISKDNNFGQNKVGEKKKIVLEFSGPNTNKPQHVGHLRNNVLGQSLVQILQACDYHVTPVNIINDRGIHIVKSMLAWQQFGNGETPKSSGIKGDHLVGKYYVMFSQKLNEERKEYCQKNNLDFSKLSTMEARQAEEKFLGQSQWMAKAHAMLLAWEKGDEQVKKLWQTMNSWVYDGYKITYDRLGIKFAKNYYESETYLLGKDIIAEGLKKNVFYKKEDNSVWIDLSEQKLEEKLVLRSDGTAVYITQDLGTAKSRYDEFKFDQAIYVVASEQERHFQVLFAILKKLGYSWANRLYHLSYGMMALPSGRIKSREGQTADADDLMDMVHDQAKAMMAAAKKQINTSPTEEEKIAEAVGLGALKFFVLGTNPQKNITFNPAESISFDGYTGPFIQYTHARINNLLIKSGLKRFDSISKDYQFNEAEKKLINCLVDFPETIVQSAYDYNPAVLAQYLFNIAKVFNNFYQEHSVLQAENTESQKMRLAICAQSKKVIAKGLSLLGIEAPEVM